MKMPILVWQFYDAPKEFQNLSRHGGDEDWLAFVPHGQGYDWVSWLEPGSEFGCCSITHIKLKDGTVYIGAHS